MYKLIVIAIALICPGSFALFENVGAETLSKQVRQYLRNRIDAPGTPQIILVEGEPIYSSAMLLHFYERRTFQPVWSDDKGPLPQADALTNEIRQADREGLRPNDYHLDKIETILNDVHKKQIEKKLLNPSELADLDLLLTDAFLTFSSHLLAGCTNPELFDSKRYTDPRESNLVLVLETALSSNKIEEVLRNLLPSNPAYTRLRQALMRYREIAATGGWHVVPYGSTIRAGDRGERVETLRTRLIAEGYLDQKPIRNKDLLDDDLEQAVRAFQKRHGLEVDGAVGPATLGALNVSAQERVRQIEIHMERWRLLPHNLGQRYVIVNVPSFQLYVVEDGQIIMTMNAVVGQLYWRTPVFSTKMTYLVLNPSWNIPRSIAIQEVVPIIRKNPGYLTEHKIRVFQGSGAKTQRIDPKTIDWSKVSARNFRYRFRQDPGPKNPLGRVKFMFPNEFNVYIHDTPSQELFSKTERCFSHGCIRIEKPIDLAEYVLRSDPRWTREKILSEIETGKEKVVPLPEPIPVYILYLTAWVDEEGTVQFRKDLYGHDRETNEDFCENPYTMQ
ncbi:MAG TPA: L,D-transpeptidase family protein [Thermodesulfobacteriota bacterium]|nr:L,D-transpeptidase family protein [Thermodesulfobacteriota bacterium]